MSIQRWTFNVITADDNGGWVEYADHVAAVTEAEQQAGERSHGHYMDGYAAALDAARDAVLALCDCGDRWGPCEMKRMAAAIDALRGAE